MVAVLLIRSKEDLGQQQFSLDSLLYPPLFVIDLRSALLYEYTSVFTAREVLTRKNKNPVIINWRGRWIN